MLVTLCGTSMQSPAAQTIGAEVYIHSSTMIPPADPIRTPAVLARRGFATFFVQTTARSHGISPADVATARPELSPPKPFNTPVEGTLGPLSLQSSCTPAL